MKRWAAAKNAIILFALEIFLLVPLVVNSTAESDAEWIPKSAWLCFFLVVWTSVGAAVAITFIKRKVPVRPWRIVLTLALSVLAYASMRYDTDFSTGVAVCAAFLISWPVIKTIAPIN